MHGWGLLIRDPGDSRERHRDREADRGSRHTRDSGLSGSSRRPIASEGSRDVRSERRDLFYGVLIFCSFCVLQGQILTEIVNLLSGLHCQGVRI